MNCYLDIHSYRKLQKYMKYIDLLIDPVAKQRNQAEKSIRDHFKIPSSSVTGTEVGFAHYLQIELS